MLKFPRSALLLARLCRRRSAGRLRPWRQQGKGDTAYVARDVNSLYAAAKQTMDQGDYEQAAKLFDEVERQHPYSVWARRAQLMSAFNYYLAEKYTDAISSARRFVTIHPGNAEAPYAQYLIAMSYYQQIADVTRDQTTTQSGGGRLRRADPPLPRYALRRRCAAQARPHQRPPRRQGDGGRPLLPALGPVAGGDLSASAMWSTITRRRATRRKRWSGWSNAISRWASPTRRARTRPCSAAIIRAAIGTSSR